MPTNIPRNPSFYLFTPFLIVSLNCFINKLDSSGDLNILMILLISSFGINNLVICKAMTEGELDPNIFLWTVSTVADATAVIPNSIRTLLGNGSSTFFIRHWPLFSNGLKILPRNPSSFMKLSFL